MKAIGDRHSSGERLTGGKQFEGCRQYLGVQLRIGPGEKTLIERRHLRIGHAGQIVDSARRTVKMRKGHGEPIRQSSGVRAAVEAGDTPALSCIPEACVRRSGPCRPSIYSCEIALPLALAVASDC